MDTNPPTETDFKSHRKRWPDRTFGVDECQARSVSVWDEAEACKKIMAIPLNNHKRIAKLLLNKESGRLRQVGNKKQHFSWWIYSGFEPLTVCEIIE
ncbi:hypothetical protein MBAV_002898 [Candidatus Magnetobacterium bavaricum]|uniref:Uncharacterized protein n=1 Tax=Candidatus Magnetobacterium bavaricum TaxID=29290 RepID=A0A0F3GSV2_9BACT|nr:hypothetical protein MBAV_002898 [Candidatus Magnetobacterium bavaricum]